MSAYDKEALRRGRLYEDLCKMLESDIDHTERLISLSHEHGRSEVAWMLELIKSDIDEGKRYG